MKNLYLEAQAKKEALRIAHDNYWQEVNFDSMGLMHKTKEAKQAIFDLLPEGDYKLTIDTFKVDAFWGQSDFDEGESDSFNMKVDATRMEYDPNYASGVYSDRASEF